MAGTEYTEKQLADHMAAFNRGEGLPDGSLFDPAAFARGGVVLRKMTPEERRDHGLPPASDAKDANEQKEG